MGPIHPVRPTPHELLRKNPGEWVDELGAILRACRKSALADRLSGHAPTQLQAVLPEKKTASPQKEEPAFSASARPLARVSSSITRRLKARTLFVIRSRYKNAQSAIKLAVRGALHQAESRYRYFLPYHLSSAREDEFYRSVEELAGQDQISSALVIGAPPARGALDALLSGVRNNPHRPSVHHLRIATRDAGGPEDTPSTRPKPAILELKELHQIPCFDLIMVHGSAYGSQTGFSDDLCSEMQRAQVVLLQDINAMPNFDYHVSLLRHPAFALLDHNPDLHNGYSIFTRGREAPGPVSEAG